MELKVKKTDMFTIPFELLVINHESNGRFAPHEPEEIDALAKDIKANGQKQPIGVKKIRSTDKYNVVYGFGRATAIGRLNDDGLAFPVKAIVVQEDEAEQFLSNVSENYFRKHPTEMDNAHNIRRMIVDFNMTQAQVAEKYGKSQSWVSQRLIINELNHDIKMKLHKGIITFSDALAMAKDMDPEQQKEVAATINAAESAVTAKIADKIVQEVAAETNHEKVSKVKANAAKEVKTILKKVAKESIKTVNAKKDNKKPAASKQQPKVEGGRTPSDMRRFLEDHMDQNKYSKKVVNICGILLNGWDGRQGLRDDALFSQFFVDEINRVVPQAKAAH